MSVSFRLFPMLLAGALLVFPAVLTACQKQDAPSKVKTYANDGLLGLSDVNPNMPMSPTYHTYQKDTDLMEETIKQVPHVIDSNIMVNGPMITVNLYVPGNLSDEQFTAVEKDAYDKLTKAMPRYAVRIFVYRKS
jgi:Fe-S oxidoreductase